ncbi:hypothetical protein BFP72_04485 [Reichenbachiella sp. 5M10]|uniref:YHYH protein n=1 Tax=Reichenbachiella sp. 5M10 TaxID=1889772 RepID=UPI000C146298|nr:YHYH protein [Reichenbachiella sp. 5M10]PIB34717.1 hypothetical protein BFP72_04485 [Reichenbachiella sp. 5M10]
MKNISLKTILITSLWISSLVFFSCEEEPLAIENTPPTIENVLADISLQAGFEEKTIPLGSVFGDADEDEIQITASSSDTKVITVSTDVSSLVITEEGIGQSTLTLRADDGKDGTVSTTFKVTVSEVEVNNAPMIKVALEDLNLESGFQSKSLPLSQVFEDIDGDELVLSLASSNKQVLTVTLDGENMTLTEIGEGSATVEVTATDPEGETATDSFTVQITDHGPVLVTAPTDLSLTQGFGSHDLSLSSTFEDPTQAGLSYSVNSDNVQVATVSLSDNTLVITEVGTGTATLTIEASNSTQKTVSTSFVLSITAQTDVEELSINFGEHTGNSVHIDSWTTLEATGYALVISDQSTFSPLVDGYEPTSSITYLGSGQQVLYLGNQSAAVEALLLGTMTTYYFKIYPYNGDYLWDTEAHTVQSASTNDCSYSSTTISEVCFDYSTPNIRTISSNQYPSHTTGNFPNADPTAIQVTRSFGTQPSMAQTVTYVYDETGPPTPSNQNFYQFGMAINGVEFHPMGLKPWTDPSTGEENWKWQEQVTEEGSTHLDAYGAHVTSQGNYHYHGDITGLASDEDGSQHSTIYGFAGDGFPIYYKYGYVDQQTTTSGIKELVSSYRLKSGSRSDDGVAGTDYPDGSYDGTYIQDYEYVSGLGDLDECNGRWGITPEYPNGTYYYVITTDFPVTPNCFKGSPDADWIIGR